MATHDLQHRPTTKKFSTFDSTTKIQSTTSGSSSDLQLDAMFYYVNVILNLFPASLIAVFGVFSNVINVVVYHHQGVKDSVTVTFIVLSLWDLGICVMSVLSYICAGIETHFPKATPTVNLLAVQYAYIAYTRGCMYVLSTIVTMYLSVERCICIIIPFRVRGIFTKSRSIVTNVIILVLCAIIFCPAWATQGLQWGFDPQFNRTRLVLWLAPERREVDIFIDIFNGAVLPTIAQVVITVSTVLMISAINTSSKFRQKAAGISSVKEEQLEKQNSSFTETEIESNVKNKVMSSKDSKLAKIVVLVAIIFFICNLPVLTVSAARAFIPELDFGKQYNNIYYAAYNLVYDFVLINSSVNIFVYYSVSSRYKEVFVSLFAGNESHTKRK